MVSKPVKWTGSVECEDCTWTREKGVEPDNDGHGPNPGQPKMHQGVGNGLRSNERERKQTTPHWFVEYDSEHMHLKGHNLPRSL